jgi:hypothetical protein
MTMKNAQKNSDGGPAFPIKDEEDFSLEQLANGAMPSEKTFRGISKREWFAGMALQGILIAAGKEDIDLITGDVWAITAFDIADAMLRCSISTKQCTCRGKRKRNRPQEK